MVDATNKICLIVLLCLVTCCVFDAFAQRQTTVGFWNVENLYDTIPSPFYDDSDYTPKGKLRWDSERYNNKLCNLATVIDAMSLDIIGLSEVEGEVAVRDLVEKLETDYNYIHRVGGDRRGMDLALLYKGDKFVPEKIKLVNSRTSREFLYVKGELYGCRIDIVVCHLPSQLNKRTYRERAINMLYNFADSLHSADSKSRVVIVGDFNALHSDKAMKKSFGNMTNPFDGVIYSPLNQLSDRGKGSYVYNDRWRLYDNIYLSTRFISGVVRYANKCGVFVRDFMIDKNRSGKRYGYPLRTFSSGKYSDGYSDHLPVFVYLEITED